MDTNPELEKLRQEVDVADSIILGGLSRRREIVAQIAEVKAAAGIEAHQPDRFDGLLANIQHQAVLLGLDVDMVTGVWHAIHEASLRQQNDSLPAQ